MHLHLHPRPQKQMVVHRLRIHGHAPWPLDCSRQRRRCWHVWLWICHRLHVLRLMGTSSERPHKNPALGTLHCGSPVHLRIWMGPRLQQGANGLEGHERGRQNPFVILHYHGSLHTLLYVR